MHDPKPVNLMPHPAMLHEHAKRLRSPHEVHAARMRDRNNAAAPVAYAMQQHADRLRSEEEVRASRRAAPPGMGVYEPPQPRLSSKDIFIEIGAWVVACGILAALGLWLVS